MANKPETALDIRPPALSVFIELERYTAMPKQKTHKGIKKRFRLTATGKAKHRKAFRGHRLSHKGRKRTRMLRKDGVLDGPAAEMVLDGLRPCL